MQPSPWRSKSSRKTVRQYVGRPAKWQQGSFSIQVEQVTDAKEYQAFTLIELLVVIAIIAILAAMLMPVLSEVRGRAKLAYCQNNMRQVYLAVVMYNSENDRLTLHYSTPTACSSSWQRDIAPYLGLKRADIPNANCYSINQPWPDVFTCPLNAGKRSGVPWDRDWPHADGTYWNSYAANKKMFSWTPRLILWPQIVPGNPADIHNAEAKYPFASTRYVLIKEGTNCGSQPVYGYYLSYGQWSDVRFHADRNNMVRDDGAILSHTILGDVWSVNDIYSQEVPDAWE
ncbi:MAG: prepilin-type N-terminal cleavage/methylation domain-containing protein [Planctomycetes bacterium]|nr:prepilin-type N-terminal cleavage/methylation domain-containing protein [Planctomycetota bacterium]